MKKVVLVVDDPQGTLQPLSDALDAARYDVTRILAPTAEEAVQPFSDTPPEIVLVQLYQGGGSGVTLTEAVRQRPDGAIVPILFFGTGMEMVTSVSDALAVGGDYYFQHPIDVTKVIAKIRAYIGVSDDSPMEEEITKPAGVSPAVLMAKSDDKLEELDFFGDQTQPGADLAALQQADEDAKRRFVEEAMRAEAEAESRLGPATSSVAADIAEEVATDSAAATAAELERLQAQLHEEAALERAARERAEEQRKAEALQRQAEEKLAREAEEARALREQEERAREEAEKRKAEQAAKAREREALAERERLAERARVEAETRARERAELEARARAESEARLREREAALEAKARAQAEAERLRVEREREARAEAEARARAEIEAKARTEAEARARAEIEAKARAEAEARAQAAARTEAEMRKRVEEEARRRVEIELKVQQETEARKRLEEEARAKEAELRRLASAAETREAALRAEMDRGRVNEDDIKKRVEREVRQRLEGEVRSSVSRVDGEALPVSTLKAPPNMAGVLDAEDIAEVFGGFVLNRITGRVRFLRGAFEKVVSFDGGKPVELVSNDPADRLEDFLYREHFLTRSQYQVCRLKQLPNPRQMGAAVIAEGFLKAQELFEVVRQHFEHALHSLFEWESGTYTFEGVLASPEDRIVLPQPPERLVSLGIKRRYTLERLIRRLGGPSSLLVGLENPDTGVDRLGFDPRERAIVRLVDGAHSIEDMVFTTGLSEERVYQVLAALIVFKLAEVAVRGIEGPSAGDLAHGGQIDRARIKEKFDLAKRADYFEFLGLETHATEFEIERALQNLRRAFSKERFPVDIGQELAEELKEIDRVLADAEYVLSDARLRDAYIRHMQRARPA